MFLHSPMQNAANWRNPDAAGEKYRRPGNVLVKRERSSRTTHFEFGAASSGLQSHLEGSLAHAQSDHRQTSVMGRICKREYSGSVAFAIHERLREGKISVLPSSKFVICSIRVEPECHRIPGNSLTIHQCHFVVSHKPSSLSTLQEPLWASLRFPIA